MQESLFTLVKAGGRMGPAIASRLAVMGAALVVNHRDGTDAGAARRTAAAVQAAGSRRAVVEAGISDPPVSRAMVDTGSKTPGEVVLSGVEHHRAQVGDIEMHWVTAGTGDPVVLLHGWPQTWYEWRHLIPVLASRYRVIAPDLRGWGETERPAGGYEVATAAADVARLLDHLGVGAAHVIGHDWGTPIGYHLAAMARDRVASFIALEASIPGAGGEDLLNFSQAWNPLWFFPFLATPELPQQLVGGGRQERFFSWMLRQMTQSTPGSLTPEDIAVYTRAYGDDDAVRSSCAYYANTWTSARQIRDAAQVPLSIPVLAVAGEQSLGQSMIAFVRRLAPSASGVILPGCGHLIPEERPTELAGLVTEFLAGASR